MNTFLEKLSLLLAQLKAMKRLPFANLVSNIWLGIKVTAVTILLGNFFNTFNNRPYVIMPFKVPEELTKSGHDGEAVVEQILLEMNKILNYHDSSTSRASAFRQLTNAQNEPVYQRNVNEGKEPDGFEIEAWFRTARKLVGKGEKNINGNILKKDKDSYKIILSIEGRPSGEFESALLNDLYVWAAKQILEKTEPLEYFNYSLKISNLTKADSLLKAVKNKETTDYKIAAVNLEIAQIRQKTDTSKSVENLTKFIQIMVKVDSLCQPEKGKLSAYVRYFGTLVATTNWIGYNIKDSGTFKNEISTLRDQFSKWRKAFNDSNRKENVLNGEGYNVVKAKSYIQMSLGYLTQYFEPQDKKAIESHYSAAFSINPNDVFILNSMAYHCKDKSKTSLDTARYKDSTFFYLNQALAVTNRKDGNIYDSYAECLLHFRDTCGAFRYLDSALMYQKTIDGITISSYAEGKRFENLKKIHAADFKALLDRSFSKKNTPCDLNIPSKVTAKVVDEPSKIVQKERKIMPPQRINSTLINSLRNTDIPFEDTVPRAKIQSKSINKKE